MRERIKIILNPISGSGRAGRLGRKIVERLARDGCTADLAETGKAGDARRFAGEVEGYAAIAGLGGDGTINEVLNGLPDDSPPLTMIPCGTANVLAKELGLPNDVEGVAKVLRDGGERKVDVGVDRASGRKFVLFLSAGFDAHVVHVFHAGRRGPISMWHYIAWGLGCMLGFKIPRMTVELDGAVRTREASWVLISNAASYGGPLVFTPRAKPDDGQFEVMILEKGGWSGLLWMFARALLGWAFRLDLGLHGLTFTKAHQVRITSAESVPVQVDGDPGGHLPADVEVRPSAIRVLTPASR